MPWVIVGVIAGLAALLGGWFWWWWPKRQVDRLRLSDPKARADVEDNFRKTIGQFIGGAAVLFGAWVAYLQFSQQQQTSQQQFLQQQQASRDLLISNQVAKGFEQLGQLGNDKVVLRLGGIYALEGVMNTSKQYHQPVLETLSAFVRDGTQTATGDGPPATDIQAALTVIGRRLHAELSDPAVRLGLGDAVEGVDLANAHIPKADLLGAYLNGARLSGADLSGAYLSGADLRGANLSGANLSGADLIEARLIAANLSGAKLSGADLRGAKLSIADLSIVDLSGANLTGANLTGAALFGATVSQEQLNNACGTKGTLDSGLTLKPCR
jgi:uncharacterized protein YjbI with pentapeptide repeats